MEHILVYSDIKNLFSIAEAKNIIFFYKKILDLVVRKGNQSCRFPSLFYFFLFIS